MSVLNQSGEEQVECPLCMEPLEVDDLHFYPCTCGYQICRFCWNRIREGENGLCPACRKAYPENPADFTPLSQEQVAAIKTEKKAREQKRRNKTLESRRALANVRVVQNNLVFVVGLPVRLADPEILKRQEYFGKYGKIHKVVINQSTTYAGSQGPSASAYVTYVSSADALRAIQGVNNVTLDGRVLKGSLGTTKYCANFMKNQPCPKPECMYLHELGDPKASFTKEEMHAGLHQVYERKLHNQLLQAQRDKPDDKQNNSSGNSSTNAEKSSSKDGNQSNFIPTTVVTPSHINVVNSSKSNKKECVNGNSGSSSAGSSNGVGSNGSGKEAWPSLGSSPPSDSPARKQPSPKPQHTTVKSQENGTSESSSPTQQVQQQAQTKQSKDTHTDSKTNRSKETNSTNGQSSKKSKTDNKSKQKSSNSINNDNNDTETLDTKQYSSTQTTHTSVFDSETQSFLSNELDDLDSDRHSLLDKHSLLDDERDLRRDLLDHDLRHDLRHDLLSDTDLRPDLRTDLRVDLRTDLRHDPLAQHKPLLNGYGLLDAYLANDRPLSQINQGLMDQKELLLRDRSQSEMLMRQNELLARQHMVEPKHYMQSSSIGLDSASELLGANFHPNPNMLPPFGMRVDNSMGGSSLSASSLGGNSMGFMMHNQQLLQQNQQQMQQTGLVNGFDAPQSANEVRYLAENMDKFFTDFHKAQQMRLQLQRGAEERRFIDHGHYPHNMLSAERLEMEHKQRMNNIRGNEGNGGRAAGDGDDDLDFDPFKETQKAFAELMETEMMQNTVSSGDNMDRVRRSRHAPPGFSHMNAFGLGQPRPQQTHHQSYNSNSAMFSDWTQMDPAIMSTSVNSVNFGKNVGVSNANTSSSSSGVGASAGASALSQQQQELFARFNQLGVQPNGVKLHAAPSLAMAGAGPMGGSSGAGWGQKLGWGVGYAGIPLPPGFAPAKSAQHPAECIDAK
ncbi:uncharacterized protein LOC111364484 isoform X1 [Spodoptera litura]|uniref:CCR4-NOT transcription complex subunit 4 n=1 Tax=Spodoptera litura TaxID=69820 RepID=A0A9J7EWT9_SPOLT|nr:uncharacterized protein LOC111364484 isoform X1 [Spodoptera litura]XP_022837149.1 uncharacterized protein LOC111364484 isoform X1 [Spodoptera litura]